MSKHQWERNYPPEFYPIEELLTDETVRTNLGRVQADFDNLYAGIEQETRYMRHHFGFAITASGICIEASSIATPFPDGEQGGLFAGEESAKRMEHIEEHHLTKEYVIFMFNVATVDPAKLRPLPLEKKHITEFLGSGIWVQPPGRQDTLLLPQQEDESIMFNDERTLPVARVLKRLE